MISRNSAQMDRTKLLGRLFASDEPLLSSVRPYLITEVVKKISRRPPEDLPKTSRRPPEDLPKISQRPPEDLPKTLDFRL